MAHYELLPTQARIYYNQWFSDDTLAKDERFLKELTNVPDESLLAKHIRLLQTNLNSDALFYLKETLTEVFQNQIEPGRRYFLVIHRHRSGALFFFILYHFDEDEDTVLHVDQMGRCASGVRAYLESSSALEYNPEVDVETIFRNSIRDIAAQFPTLQNVQLQAASKGSQLLVYSVWKQERGPTDDTLLPLDAMKCQICARLSEEPLTFDIGGGIFCSTVCAALQWEQWKFINPVP